MKRLPVALATALFGLVISAPSVASAHAALASSTPANKAKIMVMPDQVSLTLNEPIQAPAFVSVVGEDGARVNSKVITVQDKTATSDITKPAAAGSYKMNYRIVSADGHPVTGTVAFEVLEGETPTPTPTPTPSPTASAPSDETDEASGAPSKSSGTKDALTVLGFFAVAMGGLIFLVRAGMRTADNEVDNDID